MPPHAMPRLPADKARNAHEKTYAAIREAEERLMRVQRI